MQKKEGLSSPPEAIKICDNYLKVIQYLEHKEIRKDLGKVSFVTYSYSTYLYLFQTNLLVC